MAADIFPSHRNLTDTDESREGTALSDRSLTRQQTAWHILALIAVVELMVAAWLISLAQPLLR